MGRRAGRGVILESFIVFCCWCWCLSLQSIQGCKTHIPHKVEGMKVINNQNYPRLEGSLFAFRVQKSRASSRPLSAFCCFPVAVGRPENIVKHLTSLGLRSFMLSPPPAPPPANRPSFVRICFHHRSTCCLFQLQHYLLIQRFIFNEAPCQCLNSIRNKEKTVFPKQLLLLHPVAHLFRKIKTNTSTEIEDGNLHGYYRQRYLYTYRWIQRDIKYLPLKSLVSLSTALGRFFLY